MKLKEFVTDIENRRQALQRKIDDLLNAFIDETGLIVDSVTVNNINVTTVSSKHRECKAQSIVEISLP
jgi:hypothetical protein